MLAGFAAAFFIGDLFLAVRGASSKSIEFLFGVAGFSLAQIFWTLGQLREAKPDFRIFLAVAFPLAAFVFVRLRPPVLTPPAEAAVAVYSLLTALSFATALATRRVFYVLGIGLLLFSDLMIGMRFLRAPGCGELIGPTYLAAEACLLTSFFWRREWRLPQGRIDIWRYALVGGTAAFVCFMVAALIYPGGGYNPFRQMLSALGRTTVRKVLYPPCHYWFVSGMFFAAASVAGVWARLSNRATGWRHLAVGWGGAVNVAGLLTIAAVPENVLMEVHNLGCHLAALGGAAILAARFRKGGDLIWACWLLAVIAFFSVCLWVKAIPFSPWVTATQKVLIASFAIWTGWLAWHVRRNESVKTSSGSPCADESARAPISCC